jgi:hypothetical protein
LRPDVGIHRIAHHNFVGGEANALASEAHHERIGLTDVVARLPVADSSMARDGAAAGLGTIVRWAPCHLSKSGVPGGNEPMSLLGHFEVGGRGPPLR